MHVLAGDAWKPSFKLLCDNLLVHLEKNEIYPAFRVRTSLPFLTNFFFRELSVWEIFSMYRWNYTDIKAFCKATFYTFIRSTEPWENPKLANLKDIGNKK